MHCCRANFNKVMELFWRPARINSSAIACCSLSCYPTFSISDNHFRPCEVNVHYYNVLSFISSRETTNQLNNLIFDSLLFSSPSIRLEENEFVLDNIYQFLAIHSLNFDCQKYVRSTRKQKIERGGRDYQLSLTF